MITSYILLTAVTAAIVALWPILSGAMKRGARPVPFGLVLSLSGLAGGILASLTLGKPVVEPTSSLLRLAGGVGFAVGFCVLMFRALEIGPTGPTATINNLALIWPILVSLLFFSRSSAGLLVWIGLLFTLLTLVLMGWQKAEPGHATSTRWFLMAIGGFLLAGVNGAAQFLSAQWAAGQSLSFGNAMFSMACIILGFLAVVRKQCLPTRVEGLAGIVAGLLFAWVVIPLSIVLQERLPAYVVLSVSQAGSLIVVVLIGRVFLKEHLSPAKWVACVFGIAAIVCLTL